ncbi:MAG: oxygen-independent coproporphyrinogen III oxidase [Saprospiraceae bacterium]|nr:oxygen-independent coproporphyrinogen III oxidase [Saprospiraceae bacterium]
MEEITAKQIDKYSYPVPRYTSYPTVPHWNSEHITQDIWHQSLRKNLDGNGSISIYIHLPFCEQLCTYCGCNKRITKNHAVEARYIDALLKEFKSYLKVLPFKPTLDELHIGGGTPTFFTPESLESLLKPILQALTITPQTAMSFEAHPHFTTKAHLKCLYNMGFRRLSLGVQDISPIILKAINRTQNSAEVMDLTESARQIGYNSIGYDLIYGLPFQTIREIDNTLQFVASQRPDRIAYYSYAHVPWKSKSQRAYSLDDLLTGYDKYRLKSHLDRSLKFYGYKAVGMDHYGLDTDELVIAQSSRKLHRNFMGYTDKKPNLLIGLGCSAISESQDLYVQNEKNVEAYETRVHADGSAIVKGHCLTEEERKMKKHITELFCLGQTFWSIEDIENKSVDLKNPQLVSFEEEGLIYITKNGIRLKGNGMFFIRNICAALDTKFQKSPKAQFSQSI